MAVPRHSHTRSKVGKTRMHKYIKRVALNVCPKCKKPVLSHTVCKNCGYYKGVMVVDVMADLTKKERKVKEKEIKQVEQEHKHEELKP
jgi:large subunit ribosomal protein L32